MERVIRYTWANKELLEWAVGRVGLEDGGRVLRHVVIERREI